MRREFQNFYRHARKYGEIGSSTTAGELEVYNGASERIVCWRKSTMCGPAWQASRLINNRVMSKDYRRAVIDGARSMPKVKLP